MAKLPPIHNPHRFAVERLREFLDAREDLVFGIGGLRRRGDGAQSAVDTAMNLPEVNSLRLSWELVEAIAEQEGVHIHMLMDEVIGIERHAQARFALFGDEGA